MSPVRPAAGIVAVVLALAASAAAQPPQPPQPPQETPPPTPSQPEPIEIEETVIVTATRSGKRLQDEPLRVEVIDRDEIEEKALMTPGSVAMLMGETTGLRVQTNAPSLGAATVRIQGLRGRYSQLLADGLPLYGAQGDSFSLLQVPPLDLAQVEVIKGAASALYGPAALGGVLNLVSRRATARRVETLVNGTTLGGGDLVTFVGVVPAEGWSLTALGGLHGQARRDLDDDGWTDVAGYARGVVRPRVSYADGRGGSLFVTAGVNVEDRDGGTVAEGLAPDGRPFAERLDSRRADVGLDRRWITAGGRLVAVRGSFARTGHDRTFGDARERSARHTWFGEASVMGTAGRHTWVVGSAMQQDRYRPRDVAGAAFTFTTPAVFAQDEVTLGDRASAAVSARLDVHSEYGAIASPRVSLLARPAEPITLRLSAGTGAYAPTPFVEETDETGLSRLVGGLDGLDAERARGASADLTWTRAGLDVTGTVFGSIVDDPVALTTIAQAAVRLVNLPGPTRTWGTELLARYRRGDVLFVASHAWTRSTEVDPERPAGPRREVPLTPRHTASLIAMWENETWGRLGVEAYYTGRQALEENPFRTVSRRQVLFGGLYERRVTDRVRAFVNLENTADVRLTRTHRLVRPNRLPDGRWTVDAWAPLDGRVANAGLRVVWD